MRYSLPFWRYISAAGFLLFAYGLLAETHWIFIAVGLAVVIIPLFWMLRMTPSIPEAGRPMLKRKARRTLDTIMLLCVVVIFVDMMVMVALDYSGAGEDIMTPSLLVWCLLAFILAHTAVFGLADSYWREQRREAAWHELDPKLDTISLRHAQGKLTLDEYKKERARLLEAFEAEYG